MQPFIIVSALQLLLKSALQLFLLSLPSRCIAGAMDIILTPLKQAAGGENVRILDLICLSQQAFPC